MWRIFFELWVYIFIVDVIAYSDEFLILVRTGQQNDCDPYDVLRRDFTWIWGLSLKIGKMWEQISIIKNSELNMSALSDHSALVKIDNTLLLQTHI